MSDTFPDVITKRPFDLWNSYITNELLEDVVAIQTCMQNKIKTTKFLNSPKKNYNAFS